MAKKCLNYSCVVAFPLNVSCPICNTGTIDNQPMEIDEPSTSYQPNSEDGISHRSSDDIESRIGYEPSFDIDPRIESGDRFKREATVPTEELESITIDLACPEWEVQIGLRVDPELKYDLISLLWKNIGIFAWSHQDMVGINPEHACHYLKIDPARKTVHQKRRKFGPEKYAALDAEVGKLIDNKLIGIATDEP